MEKTSLMQPKRLGVPVLAAIALASASPASAQLSISMGDNDELEQSVQSYQPGTTSWEDFANDGWFERAPTTEAFGVVKAVGDLDEILMVILAVYRGDASSFDEAASADRPLALIRINNREEAGYDPGYITNAKDLRQELPSSCIFRFENDRLIQKRCLF